MDANQRCENMPAEELQSFEAYLERIKTQVAGQGIIQEIGQPSASVAQPLYSQPQRDSLGSGSVDQNYPGESLQGYPPKDIHLGSSDGGVPDSKYPVADIKGDALSRGGYEAYQVPSPPLKQPPDQQTGPKGDTRQPGFKAFMEGMVSGSGGYSVATSQPYGVAPGTSQLLTAGQDHSIGGTAGQLAGLHLSDGKQVSFVGLQELYSRVLYCASVIYVEERKIVNLKCTLCKTPH